MPPANAPPPGVAGLYVFFFSFRLFTDFIVVKYDPAGIERWVCRTSSDSIDGQVTSIAVDAQHNVYFTGFETSWRFPSNSRIITSRVNSNGESGWVRIYVDSSAAVCRANSIAVDGGGNVVIVGVSAPQSYDPLLNQGESLVSIKYTANGTLQWIQKYRDESINGYKQTGLVLDNSGSIYIAASAGTAHSYPFDGKSSLLLKYDASGGMMWSWQFAGHDGTIASAVATDGQGNIVVAGSTGSQGAKNFLTIKYLPSGNRVWDTQANGSGCSVEGIASMTVDGQGNVYVAGQTARSGQGSDFLTVKFEAKENQLWAARYDNGLNTNDYSSKIAVAERGNVYVTGSSSSLGHNSYVTAKYDGPGEQMWARSFPVRQVPIYSSRRTSFLIDKAGRVFVGGMVGFVEYNSEGQQLQANNQGVQAVAFDRWKNVCIATQNALMKYDSTGSSSTFFSEYVDDVATDDSGNVYLTALYGGSSVGTRKFNASGQQLWAATKGGSRLFLDGLGNVIVRIDYVYQRSELACRFNN